MTKRTTKIYFVLAFIEGASVMAAELLGAKIAAVYYGNSLFVWTSILAITIAGLAGGYFAGGYFSKKFSGNSILFYTFLATCFCVLIMPVWADIVMKKAMVLGYETGAIISCILFLFPPMFFHGMISPILISRLTENINKTGNIAGTVYAVSTTGGILMTFFTGFVMIPNWGLKAGTYSVAVVLGIVPFIYFLKEKIILSVGIIFMLALFISSGMKPLKQKKNSHIRILHRSDGLLGQIIVADDLKTEKRSLLINNISQTFMHIPSGKSQWRYIHRIALYASSMPAMSEVLICGIGGGNLINEMSNLGFKVDAVDIDARMPLMAKKYFGLVASPKVYIDDARHYIRKCDKKYDVVILDMSAGENQPSNVYTIECFKEIRRIMNPGGIMFLHYQNALEGEAAAAVKSIGKTLASSGFYAKIINTEKVKPDGTKLQWDAATELMLFASLSPVDLSSHKFERRDRFADPFNFSTGRHIFIENYDFSDGILLTDDNPVMDFLHKPTLQTTRQAALDQLIPILIKEKIELF